MIINSVIGTEFMMYVLRRNIKANDKSGFDQTQASKYKDASLATSKGYLSTADVTRNTITKNIYQVFFLNLERYQLNNTFIETSEINEQELKKNMIYKFFAASKPPTNVLNSTYTNLKKRQVEDSHKQLRNLEGTYHHSIIHTNYPHPLKFLKKSFNMDSEKGYYTQETQYDDNAVIQLRAETPSVIQHYIKKGGRDIKINMSLTADRKEVEDTLETIVYEFDKYHPGSFLKTRDELYEFRKTYFIPMLHNKNYLTYFAESLNKIIIDRVSANNDDYKYLAMINNNLFDILEENIDKNIKATFLNNNRLCFYLVIFFRDNFLRVPQYSQTDLKQPLIYYYKFIWNNALAFKTENSIEINSVNAYLSKLYNDDLKSIFKKKTKYEVYEKFIYKVDSQKLGTSKGKQPVAQPYLRWIIFEIEKKIGDKVKDQIHDGYKPFVLT